MRIPRLASTALAATTFVILGMLAPAPAQQPGQQQQPAPAPAKPYKPVAIDLPQQPDDPSFEAFRKQLATIAQRKDRAALARLVAKNFFWIAQDKDVADKKMSGIDNFAKVIGLDGQDAVGWEVLASYAAEPTAEPDSQHEGALCAPADPTFDEKAAEALLKATQTDPSEWAYPVDDGIEVRSAARSNAPVVEKLGLHLVRVLPDESSDAAQADFLRIVTPSGKTGFAAVDAILPLASDQVCYAKDAGGWKIAGVYGGGAEGQ